MSLRPHVGKALAVSLATLALAGCSTVPKTPERVLVPVAAECPAPPSEVLVRPVAPAALHDRSASDAEKARALAVYISQLSGWADALEAVLRGYSKPAK